MLKMSGVSFAPFLLLSICFNIYVVAATAVVVAAVVALLLPRSDDIIPHLYHIFVPIPRRAMEYRVPGRIGVHVWVQVSPVPAVPLRIQHLAHLLGVALAEGNQEGVLLLATGRLGHSVGVVSRSSTESESCA